jgi:hypothetical protein
VIGQCLEQALALWLKAVNGLNEANDAGLKEVVELNLAMTANVRSSGKQPHQRQVLEDHRRRGQHAARADHPAGQE